MNRRGAETQSFREITEQVIGACIEIHKQLGPGLLESAYEECLCYELSRGGLNFVRQLAVPVEYKGLKLDCSYRLDLLVEDTVIVEVKALEVVLPVHPAQLLTYLKATAKPVGLLINFNYSRQPFTTVSRTDLQSIGVAGVGKRFSSIQ